MILIFILLESLRCSGSQKTKLAPLMWLWDYVLGGHRGHYQSITTKTHTTFLFLPDSRKVVSGININAHKCVCELTVSKPFSAYNYILPSSVWRVSPHATSTERNHLSQSPPRKQHSPPICPALFFFTVILFMMQSIHLFYCLCFPLKCALPRGHKCLCIFHHYIPRTQCHSWQWSNAQ